jgi:hypothetical protein
MTVILDGIFERKYLVCDTRPSGQDPAVEVLAQIPLDEAWDGITVRIGLPRLRKPGLQVLLDDLVNDGLLRPSGPADRGGVPSGSREGTSLS